VTVIWTWLPGAAAVGLSAIQQGGQQRGFLSGRRPAWFKFMLLALPRSVLAQAQLHC
jgi:hypothetical protein